MIGELANPWTAIEAMARSFLPPARPLADLAGDILDPVLRKRAGLSVALVQSWEEIVGAALAARTRPEKIAWPRRFHEDDPFEPATLVIACEGPAALHVQHQTGEIIGRVNSFLGFAAVGRIRLVQKPVTQGAAAKPGLRELAPAEKARVAATVAGIEDAELRASLERLGRSVRATKKPG